MYVIGGVRGLGSNEIVWLDASTPKRLLLSASLAEILRARGFRPLVTVRSYDYSLMMLPKLGVHDYIVVGVHGGGTLKGKLVADIGRMIDLIPVLEDKNVVALISYPSPPAVRVAYGLGIPYIAMGDTPHGEAMNRLSYPLARVAILSEFIAEDLAKYFLKDFTVIETYRGVDELLWVKRFECNKHEEDVTEAGLKPLSYVVLRPEEFMAHYYDRRGESIVIKLSEVVLSEGYTPVVLPRYESQLIEVKSMKGVKVIEKPILGPALECHAVAVVTGGITMAREAALLGVPGISVFSKPIRIDVKLAELGLPISYARDYEEASYILRKILRDPESHRVESRKLIESLETPESKVVAWVEALASEAKRSR
ncbi:MAG: DUF354 domain-containing protein [Acidilobaceae archaeon]